MIRIGLLKLTIITLRNPEHSIGNYFGPRLIGVVAIKGYYRA